MVMDLNSPHAQQLADDIQALSRSIRTRVVY